jgi:predicted TIM-barrel fold metal-dependent hydrolase
MFHSVPPSAVAQDWVDAANHYLSDRMLYASSYPVRPLKQSLEEFRRFSYNLGVLENLLARNVAELFGIAI